MPKKKPKSWSKGRLVSKGGPALTEALIQKAFDECERGAEVPGLGSTKPPKPDWKKRALAAEARITAQINTIHGQKEAIQDLRQTLAVQDALADIFYITHRELNEAVTRYAKALMGKARTDELRGHFVGRVPGPVNLAAVSDAQPDKAPK